VIDVLEACRLQCTVTDADCASSLSIERTGVGWRVRDAGALVWHGDLAGAAAEAAVRVVDELVASGCASTVIHAGVVLIGGDAVLIPGASMSGKTTLVRTLVEDFGCGFLSDEYAPISATDEVAAVPLPMRVRADDGTRRLIHQVSPVSTAKVRAVVKSTFSPGGTTSVEAMSRADTFKALFENSFGPEHDGLRASTIAKIARSAEGLRLRRGPAREAATALLDALGS
jgi:hypothetical protein